MMVLRDGKTFHTADLRALLYHGGTAQVDSQVKDREAVNREDSWKLEASLEDSTFDFFFSVKTGLLIRFDTDQHVPNGTSSVSISDYRRVDKVLFAFGAAQTAGPVKWSRKLTEVKFNAPIDNTVFSKPQKTASN